MAWCVCVVPNRNGVNGVSEIFAFSILCTNRDEFLARPTTNAHFHGFESADDQPTSGQVLSGRDQKAGGTWFGLNRTGRVALL